MAWDTEGRNHQSFVPPAVMSLTLLSPHVTLADFFQIAMFNFKVHLKTTLFIVPGHDRPCL
jgi:hypothetical protein